MQGPLTGRAPPDAGQRRAAPEAWIRVAAAQEPAVPAAAAPAYTPGMGAVDTMDVFFERLNTGDREAAVQLFDEKAEMRIHVLGNVKVLRGEQMAGWFLRADRGMRMLPGEGRDTGNTFECNLLVVRPGAQSQELDAIFRVEAGKITAINFAPR